MFRGSLVSPTGTSWDWVNEGLNANGCKTNATADALCVFNDGTGNIGPDSLNNFSFTFDISLDAGAFFPEFTHLKVRWLDGNDNKLGDLISQDISWSKTVPEPGILALLGIGIIGIGLARRKV